MSIMKALLGTLRVSTVAILVKIRSVRPTVASAAGTNDLQLRQVLSHPQFFLDLPLKQCQTDPKS